MEERLEEIFRMICTASGSIVTMLVKRRVSRYGLEMVVQNLRMSLERAEGLLRETEQRR